MSCQKCGSTDTYCGCDEATAIAERDAALAELAALKKRVADAEWIRVHASMSNGIARYLMPPTNVSAPGRYALVRLEDGE
jgi:hypothetical protein